MKKIIVAVALAVVFVMSLAVPAFAQMTHTVTYEMDGVIDYQRQAGHACNTGGVHKQTIVGAGEMSKTSGILMIPGRLTMTDNNDFVAGEAALTVTSVIELCAPPKYVYEGNSAVAGGTTLEAPVRSTAIYGPENHWATAGRGAGSILGTTHEELATIFEWEALTEQIWAVQVQADPGFSGNLHQDFEAADGPYWAGPGELNEFANEAAWNDGNWNQNHRWRWERDGDGLIGRSQGANYVGSYFDIEQHARTSMGTVQRYIDVSSPFSHGYLMEDMSVIGKSDINEAFSMTNLAPGADVPGDWWDLF